MKRNKLNRDYDIERAKKMSKKKEVILADKQSTKQPKRNPAEHLKKYQWEPGESGNRKGRPLKEKTFSDTARELLNAKRLDVTYTLVNGKEKHVHIESTENFYHALVVALIDRGLKGDVSAIRELIDRTEGKPVQQTLLTGDEDEELKIIIEHTGYGYEDEGE